MAEIFTKVFEIEDRDENYIKFSQYTPEQIQQLEDQKETLLKKHAAGSDAVDAQSLSNVIAELNHVHVAKSVVEQSRSQFSGIRKPDAEAGTSIRHAKN